MSAETEVIADFDVLFAARTGVTILIPKTNALSSNGRAPGFWRLDDGSNDLAIGDEKHLAILKNVDSDIIDEALRRGFIMFYETVEDEVVRCTSCRLLKTH